MFNVVTQGYVFVKCTGFLFLDSLTRRIFPFSGILLYSCLLNGSQELKPKETFQIFKSSF